nr:hypothetical protein [Comamonas testosteroni]
MRRSIPIEMECHQCAPSRFERFALLLLIACCFCGIGAAGAMAWGYIEYHLGAWPL